MAKKYDEMKYSELKNAKRGTPHYKDKQAELYNIDSLIGEYEGYRGIGNESSREI